MEPDAATTVYEGPHFTVVTEEWGGREYDIVKHPGSAAIVAVHDGEVVLVRQRRAALRKELLELPAGIVDRGEDPLDAARRELEEEVGLRGGRWRRLATLYPSAGFLDEVLHLFVAEDLEHGEQDLEDGEEVRIVRWRVEEIERRLAELEDMKTVAALVLYLRAR